MYCVNHETVESVTLCHACGKSICGECRHDVKGVNYCPNCLAQAVERPPVMQPPKTPGLAAFLGFIPGVGAIYNGEYLKAVAFIAVFAGLVQACDRAHGGSEVFLGLSMAAFYFFMIVDSYKSAQRINERAASGLAEATADIPLADGQKKESLAAGVIIMALGLLFQLDNFGLFNLDRIWELWPLAIIVIGIIMLKNYFTSGEERKNV